jgi:hypothetical protein
MQEIIDKLNRNLLKKAPEYEIRYYNNEHSQNKPLFQMCRQHPPSRIKYVYFQTREEKEIVKEYRKVLGE